MPKELDDVARVNEILKNYFFRGRVKNRQPLLSQKQKEVILQDQLYVSPKSSDLYFISLLIAAIQDELNKLLNKRPLSDKRLTRRSLAVYLSETKFRKTDH